MTTAVVPPSNSDFETGLQELLVDAKLLADYGVRAGRYHDDEGLFDAIREADAKAKESELTWSTAEAVTLNKAVGKALQTIYPVTLHDLKSTWETDAHYATGFFKKNYLRVRSFIMIFFVVLLTAYLLTWCASLTVWQQRASSLVSELSVDKAGQQEAAFDQLLVLIGSDQLAELRNPASPLRENFRQRQREIAALQRSMLADDFALERLNSYTSPNDYIGAWIGTALRTLRSTVAHDATGELKSGEERPVDASAPVVPSGTASSVEATPSGAIRRLDPAEKAAVFSDMEGDAFECNQINTQYDIDKSNAILRTASEENAVRSIRLFMSSVDFDKAFVKRMKCQIESQLSGPILKSFDIKYRLDIRSLWLLPALYGALGALIYHLRDFLSGTRPNPTFLKMVVRVGLGAFAGIAIGWFWMPKDASVLGIPEITFTPLTIAFVVGFGIDAFVAILDKIVVSINRWIAGPPAVGQGVVT